MSVIQFILTITAATASANAMSSRLTDVMSKALGHKVQLHSNVTAYDICMYLATGYQYNQLGTDTNITTEVYDDHHQGVAKILTRHVNQEYDNMTEALDSYNKTQRVVNFDLADCDGVTDDEVISWYFPSTAEGTYVPNSELSKRAARRNSCSRPEQSCVSSEGHLDVTMCSSLGLICDSLCGCAEYGSSGAACQPAHQDGTMWITNHHQNWGEVTALMIGFPGKNGGVDQRLVAFIALGQDNS